MPLLQNLQRQLRISLMIERKWNESERDYFFLGICFHNWSWSSVRVIFLSYSAKCCDFLYTNLPEKSITSLWWHDVEDFKLTNKSTLFFVYINGRHLGKHTDRWNDGGILTTGKLSLKTLGGKWAWEKLSPSMLVEESMCNSLQFFILLLF